MKTKFGCSWALSRNDMNELVLNLSHSINFVRDLHSRIFNCEDNELGHTLRHQYDEAVHDIIKLTNQF